MVRAIAVVLILLILVPPQAVLAVALPQLGAATDSEKKDSDSDEALWEKEGAPWTTIQQLSSPNIQQMLLSIKDNKKIFGE